LFLSPYKLTISKLGRAGWAEYVARMSEVCVENVDWKLERDLGVYWRVTFYIVLREINRGC
jgi:hypothetical protein